MEEKSVDAPILRISLRVYRALLVAYPTKFRREFGSEMVQVFRDSCLRTVRAGGTNGMLKLWAVTLLDVAQSAMSEHAQKEVEVKKELRPEDIRVAGWALILAGFTFITILSGSDAVAFPGSLMSTILLAVGLSVLRSLYGKSVGRFGRNSLRIALVGIALFLCLPLAALAVMGAADLMGEGLWILLFGGPAILLLGLVLFGLAALRSKPLPRLNWLPAVTGIWYPLAYFLMAAYLFTHRGIFPQQYYAAFQVLCLIQFLALCALGFILVSDSSQEMARAG